MRMATSKPEIIPTRATLLHRLKDLENQASWQEFFDIYWPLIYGVAIKQGLKPDAAQDVVQVVMTETARQMPTFKYDPAKGSFKSWLLKLTRWRIADELYRRRQMMGQSGILPDFHGDDSGLQNEPAADVSDLEAIWDEEWKKTLLEAANAKARRRLDPKQYQIFDFLVNRQWPPEKVAKALRVTPNQVYVAKHRVAETIKAEFERLQREII